MVSAGNLERIKLQRSKPTHHSQDALGFGLEGPRRRQEVAQDHEPSRDGAAQRWLRSEHRAMVAGPQAVADANASRSRSTNAAWDGLARRCASRTENHATRSTSGNVCSSLVPGGQCI